jgi:Ca2+-binding EF-hand superfamily protein
MKNLRLIPVAAAIASLVFAPVALAAKGDGPKAKAMAKYDLNHDGKLDEAELAALQKDFAAAPKGDLAKFDTDHDGKLSADELAKVVPGSGGKKGEKSEKKADGEKKHEGKKADDKKAEDAK